ncbi:MAG: cupin domain-containing protein [Xanthomonadales bacterium]|nr:cupin domain-containing protein [Xanthomonadales bacterium]
MSPADGVSHVHLERSAEESGHVTSFVKFEPGSYFPAHSHPNGEEIFVLEGVFSDENGDYPAGTYIRNPQLCLSYHPPESIIAKAAGIHRITGITRRGLTRQLTAGVVAGLSDNLAIKAFGLGFQRTVKVVAGFNLCRGTIWIGANGISPTWITPRCSDLAVARANTWGVMIA